MKRTRILLLIACCAIQIFTAMAQPMKTFYVPKPGTLVELLTEEEANQITHLRLQGKINAIDFRHLRDEFTSLRVLDLSGASISLYAGKGGTHPDKYYVYRANCIPAFAFCRRTNDSIFEGKSTLEHVVLSDKIHSIEDAAFKGCNRLAILQIRKKSAPNLMKEALADSITAVFIPLGSGDSYRTKPQWGTFAFVEGEPRGITLELTENQSLSSEIVNRGLQPKEVNFLTIKGKLDAFDFKLIRDYMPNLVSIDMEESDATAIPEYTFTQKKYMLRIKLPKGLKSIGQRAFSGCSRLCGTIELPAGVTTIEFGAFMGCENLRHVVAHGQITTLGDNLFGEEGNKLIYTASPSVP